MDGGVLSGEVTEGVKFSKLRTALHNIKLSPQNSFDESHT